MLMSLLIAYSLHHFALPARRNVLSRISNANQLTVELHQTSGNSFRPGSQRIPVLSLTLEASCKAAVPVHAIEVRRRGLGSSSDILSVYAMRGSERLTRGRQLSRRGYAQLNLRSFVVAACSKEQIDIYADFSPDASVSGEHTFTIERASDFDTGGARIIIRKGTTINAPQRTVGTRQGNITVSYPKLLKRIRYGSGRAVMRLRLRADGKDDHRITAVTITNNGSARDMDLRSLYLEAGRRRVTRIEPEMSRDHVRLEFMPPLLLKKNQTRLLNLRADVRASRSRTVQLIIEEPGDLESEVVRGRSNR